jgi:orotidine-5'-phosphate decarboxylase
MNNFADTLITSSGATKSIMCAGIDPVITTLPHFMSEPQPGEITARSREEQILTTYVTCILDACKGSVAAVKPNAAFFEQYGLGGLSALSTLCKTARQIGIPVIMDAKRGDIGNTARAYSDAYLGGTGDFSSDALTVSPFLGYDTVTPYFDNMSLNGRGIFVLAKTSNEGSATFQSAQTSATSQTVSASIADYAHQQGRQFLGSYGYSSLGLVVGATYPEEALQLRERAPHTLFLIPGYGAQGGTASDAVRTFVKIPHHPLGYAGGIVNSSRGLVADALKTNSREAFVAAVQKSIAKSNNELGEALTRL